MKRRKSGGAYRKEKIILTASSVLVLTAMTVTGISIYNSRQEKEPENNVVDFSLLENEMQKKEEEIAQAQNRSAKNLTSDQSNSGELDYDPYYVEQERRLNEQDAADIQNAPQLQNDVVPEALPQAAAEEAVEDRNVGYAEINRRGGQENTEPAGETRTDPSAQNDAAEADGTQPDGGNTENGATDAAGTSLQGEDTAAAEGQPGASGQLEASGQPEASVQDGGLQEVVADVMQEEVSLHFGEEAKLQWPIAGNVLLNYSMDKTIYFQTLQQYKYNPSIVIGATQGTSVACAANGMVKSIYKDPQTGTTVVMNLGDGYELSYGQLQDVTVEEGDFVEAGAFIGKVAAPTKYYTVEGTNVYFKLTKDGEPVNPLNYLG